MESDAEVVGIDDRAAAPVTLAPEARLRVLIGRDAFEQRPPQARVDLIVLRPAAHDHLHECGQRLVELARVVDARGAHVGDGQCVEGGPQPGGRTHWSQERRQRVRRRVLAGGALEVVVGGVELEGPALVAGAPEAGRIRVILAGRCERGAQVGQPSVDGLEMGGRGEQRLDLEQDLVRAGVLGACRLGGDHLAANLERLADALSALFAIVRVIGQQILVDHRMQRGRRCGVRRSDRSGQDGGGQQNGDASAHGARARWD